MGSSNSPEAWFESLSTHPIFTSPASSSSSSGSQPVPATTTNSSSDSRRKNTFGISALDGAGPQGKGEAADEGDDEDDEAEMLYDKHGEEVVQKKSRVVVRGGKELIAVVGREVRLVDLKEVKEGKPARYWVSPRHRMGRYSRCSDLLIEILPISICPCHSTSAGPEEPRYRFHNSPDLS